MMDPRIIRRFGRAKKKFSPQYPTKKDIGLLTYTSYNRKWIITVDMTVESQAAGRVKRPYSGRIIRTSPRKVSWWMSPSIDGSVRFDSTDLPSYVQHAIARCCNVGIEEIGSKSRRKLVSVKAARV